jgi:hypothetical protein
VLISCTVITAAFNSVVATQRSALNRAMKRYRRRSSQKSEAQRKREAKEREAQALEKIKRKLGIGRAQPLKRATPSPLVSRGWERKPRAAPTSDRIPGSTPLKDLMHAHKWKRGAEEKASTVNAIRIKASQIGPGYNKGALQYLPSAGVSGRNRSARNEG